MKLKNPSRLERKRGVINPYLQEIRDEGKKVSSADFWKVVKRYERYAVKLRNAGFKNDLNPFAEAKVYFTDAESRMEIRRVRHLNITDRARIQYENVSDDLMKFMSLHGESSVSNPTGTLKGWNDWYFAYSKEVTNELHFKDKSEITMKDVMERYRTDPLFSKEDLFENIERYKRSPQGLSVGSL